MDDPAAFLGLDFGTESVRALVVDAGGVVRGTASAEYPHGQILPGSATAHSFFAHDLRPGFALQHPRDWTESMAQATRQACSQAASTQVEGIGVSFTSCTILPVRDRGTPLCLSDHHFASRPHAWPKLWKHHGALEQTERMNALAKARDEGWLARYGGRIGLEWFFPKVLEVIESDSEAAETTDIWIEAGDWIVWQLTGSGDTIVRSSCQAGYKALWAPDSGFPVDFLSACDPALGRAATQKAPGILAPPGTHAGGLASTFAADMGLRPGIPVSTAIIDAHAAVPGAGVAESGTLVMVLGTSGCHMVMDPGEHLVPGVAGIVADGILPGAYGYETGQAAVGDAFDWARRLCGSGGFSELESTAREVPTGSDGLIALDWLNGCRTPLMNGGLSGAIIGLRLDHGPQHLYRALMEGSACGLRWIVETLREGGVGVHRFVVTGGLGTSSPLYTNTLAAVLDAPLEVRRDPHGSALGAAVLGAMASGRFASHGDAIRAMAGTESAAPPNIQVTPPAAGSRSYDLVYERYRLLADHVAGGAQE